MTWEEFKLTWPAFTKQWEQGIIDHLETYLFEPYGSMEWKERQKLMEAHGSRQFNTLDTLQALKWATIFIRKMETDPIYAIALAGYFRERPEELDALRSIQNGVTEYFKKAAEQEQ